MADYNSIHSGATIDTTITNADAGNIGKGTQTAFTGDINDLTSSGFFYVSSSAANNPVAETGAVTVVGIASTVTTQVYQSASSTAAYIRRKLSSVWSSWQELYHTGNTSSVTFNSTPNGTQNAVNIGGSSSNGIVQMSNNTTSNADVAQFYNPNGIVGKITTSALATSYVTSSDPRLKEFKGKPSDTDINSKFELLFDAFNTFKWKSDPTGQLVWGFDAHKAIDNGLDMGTEGQGSRNLGLGAKDGNVTVTPAGVDQSKAVPILLSKLEQLERRLKTLEG